MCPIETPEGPNIGLIGSLSSFAEVSEYGFVTTPYRVVKDGVVTDKIVRLDATQEEERVIAQANTPVDAKTGKLKGSEILCRTQAGQYVTVGPKDVDLIDVSPEQIWSVATAMIPFLEHDDANRALMGSNMQRQAVPLLKSDAPLVGTGMERRAALDTGDVLLAQAAGTVDYVDADQHRRPGLRRQGGVRAAEVHALEPGHADPPQAARGHRPEGQGRRRARRRLLDRPRRDGARQEPDGRLHVLGGLQLRGRDHPLQAPRAGRRAHLDPHRGVRDRRPHDEARRGGDHPRHPQPLGGVAAQPRRPRHRPRRRRGHLGRPAGRQGHAEGRDRAHRRGEADPRDLQGEGARGPRHLAEGAPRRGRRRDRRQDLQPRRGRRPAAGRQRPRARVRGQEAQDLRGRQARGPSRQQGCDLEDRRPAGHAVPRGRHAGRRDPQPAGRALAA